MTEPDAHGTLGRASREGIPILIRAYLARTGGGSGPAPRLVRVTQVGEMFRERGGRPLGFSAVEEFTVSDVAYSWRARIPVGPFAAMRIHDGYAGGAGWMRGSFVGIPFVRRSGPDIAAGAALRYLAELPWIPQAMYTNPRLAWREVGDRVAEVSTIVDGTRRAVSFHFDDQGDIVRAFTGARPRDGDAPRPWSGTFHDYAEIGGVRIPTAAEVRWELPDGPFTYWRGRITGWESIP